MTSSVRLSGAALLAVAAGVLPAQTHRPVHHWDFETAGRVTDRGTDAARDGRLIGLATVANGTLHLDGATGYAQFDAHLIPTSPEYTIALFARATAGANGSVGREFISQGTGGAASFIGTATDGTSMRAGDNWLDVAGAMFIADGLFHHYALTLSAAASSFYIDGVLVASSAPYAGGAGGTATRLGRGPGESTGYFSGDLDDVRIYTVALEEQEIQALAKGGVGEHGLAGGTVGSADSNGGTPYDDSGDPPV